MDYSIIIPAYNEADNLPELFKQLQSAMKGLKSKFEFILVDDGSEDGTFEVVKKQQVKLKMIRGMRVRKNQGKSTAMLVGFREAKGKVLVTIDADLQDDPTEITNLINQINQGYDVVSGWRQTRADTKLRKISTWLFNHLVSKATGVQIHDFNCGLKAYKREVIASLNLSGGMHRFMPVLAAWKGFKVTEVPVTNRPRKFGQAKYGIGRALRGILDLSTIIFLQKYAKRPLRLFGTVGFGFFVVGFIAGGYLTVLRLQGENIGTRPLLTLAVLLMVLGGQFFSIGLLGEMMARNNQPDILIAEKI